MGLAGTSLLARRSPLASSTEQRAVLDRLPLAREFEQALAGASLPPLRARGIDVLQVNLGKLCNQTCRHCHVDAGPDRRETMSRATLEACLRALSATAIPCVDITGGAPELHPELRWFIAGCRALGRHVIDRCNLTVLGSPGARDLPRFFAEHRVELSCSLPHYRQTATDRQRGAGVFQRSIEALRKLNEVGYGDGVSGLRLVLVTNPVGAFLPARQASLEAEWKRELLRLHGVRFDALFTITNMPIGRFLDWLVESGNLASYMGALVAGFNPAAARAVMCRTTLSVAWDGMLHDCDFNQMLELPVRAPAARTVHDFAAASLDEREIVTGRHCFGCTAGAGSSCGGALA